MAWYDTIFVIINLDTKQPTPSQWYAALRAYIDKIELMCLDLVDVSATHRGLCPKLDGNPNHFLRSDGEQAAPPGSGGVGGATGSADGEIIVADGTGGDTIKGSGILISQSVENNNTTVPTGAAVQDALDALPVAGDVVGPASSTDNALARFDGPGGKTLQNSLMTVDDNGTANIPAAQKYKVGGADVFNTPKRTIILHGSGGKASTTDGNDSFSTVETSTNKILVNGSKFIASTSDKYHQWETPMPDNWDLGTIKAVPWIYTDSTDASDHTIIFGLQCVAIRNGDNADTAWGTAQESTITVASSIAGKEVAGAETTAITPGGTAAKGCKLRFRTYRKGADTHTGDVILTQWALEIGTNNFSDE